jgi:hypothetical protein
MTWRRGSCWIRQPRRGGHAGRRRTCGRGRLSTGKRMLVLVRAGRERDGLGEYRRRSPWTMHRAHRARTAAGPWQLQDMHRGGVQRETRSMQAYLDEGGRLFVGIGGLDEGEATGRRSAATSAATPCIDSERQGHDRQKIGADTPTKTPTTPRLGTSWSVPGHLKAIMPTARPRATPASTVPVRLEACGADFGYGWYRVRTNKAPRAPQGQAACSPSPTTGLHLYVNGGKLDRNHTASAPAPTTPRPTDVTLPKGGKCTSGLRWRTTWAASTTVPALGEQ